MVLMYFATVFSNIKCILYSNFVYERINMNMNKLSNDATIRHYKRLGSDSGLQLETFG